jgi:hypothetical protein
MGRSAFFVALAYLSRVTTVYAFELAAAGALTQEGPMMSFLARRPVIVLSLLVASAGAARAVGDSAAAPIHPGSNTVNVAGSGFDDLNNAIVHWTKPTPTGMIQQSTEIVELNGDLRGRVLYHVTSVFDFVNGTLVNTGDQVYSGTIAGSAPVMIHDDQFRFEVNLVTGKETGEVFLFNHIAGPKVRCKLDGVGTGRNDQGNPTFAYTGTCTFRGR